MGVYNQSSFTTLKHAANEKLAMAAGLLSKSISLMGFMASISHLAWSGFVWPGQAPYSSILPVKNPLSLGHCAPHMEEKVARDTANLGWLVAMKVVSSFIVRCRF